MKGWISPRGFVIAALVIAAISGVFHVAGFRPYVSILSGTAPPGANEHALMLGLAYVVAHFAFVIGAPILVLGAGVFWLFSRRSR